MKLFLFLLAAAVASAQTCDRACLENFVDLYMEALIAHKPAQLPLAPRVKNTEDGVRLDPGDGFWRTAQSKGSYRLFNADVETGNVTFLGTMREVPSLPVIFAARLKVVNRQITEIENYVVRDAFYAKQLEDLGRPGAVFTQPIPQTQRATRAALVQTVNNYLSAIQLNNGKGNYAFFTPDCNRFQNGVQTTNRTTPYPAPPPPPATGRGGANAPPPVPEATLKAMSDLLGMSCEAQFKLGYFAFVTRVRERRFVAVDRERGVVTVIWEGDQPSGKYSKVKLTDGREIVAGPMKPETFAAVEIFKVEGGKIRRVEASQLTVPYGMVTGWSTWEDGMSSKPNTVQ
ncbi:MAG: hypothetical protein RL328_1884 [Acidobacteriota bacterium]